MFWLFTKVSSIYMKWSWPTSNPMNSWVAWGNSYQFQIFNKCGLVALEMPSSVQPRKGFLSLYLKWWKRIPYLCSAMMQNQATFFRLLSNIVEPKSLALSMVLIWKALWRVLQIPPTAIAYYIWQDASTFYITWSHRRCSFTDAKRTTMV